MTTFDPNKFFEQQQEQSKPSRAAGGAGLWFLHICKAAFLLYSAAHGISASWNYAGNSDWQKAAQIAGIIIIEFTLAGLYLAFLNHKIRDGSQILAGVVTYGAGFVLASVGIVADSQLNSGRELSPWLVGYLRWGLPVAPALMAIGGLFVHHLEPGRIRDRKRADEREKLEQTRFDAEIAMQRADVEEAKAVKALQLSSRAAVVTELHKAYTSAEIQQAIKQTAIDNLLALLRAAGIHLDSVALPAGDGGPDSDGGDFSLDDLVDYLVEERLKQRQAQAVTPGGNGTGPDFLPHNRQSGY